MELPIPEAATPASSPARRAQSLAWVCVAAGLLLIAGAGLLESESLRDQPWKDALLFPDATPPAEYAGGVIPVRARRLPETALPERDPLLDALRGRPQSADAIRQFRLDEHEYLVALKAPPETLTQVLASGRIPQPGQPEVLAGDLARFDHFTLEVQTFRVVGRLQRGVSGLAFAYVLPDAPALDAVFSGESGATMGYLDPEAMVRPESEKDRALVDGQASTPDEDNKPVAVGGSTRTLTSLAYMTMCGLMCLALGGSVIQIQALRRRNARPPAGLASAIREIMGRPALVISVHAALYGVFFILMAEAVQHPLINLRVAGFVRNEFMEGNLSYIGSAYESRDILYAAAATFLHNYFVATVALTILPSIVLPFAGLLKNLLSFGLVGFVMSPIWTGSAEGMSYHSITMVLELEGYITATFFVLIYPSQAWRALRSATPLAGLAQTFRTLASGALLAGLMLALAAIYEATTLILLR